jgi:hypothetical protein
VRRKRQVPRRPDGVRRVRVRRVVVQDDLHREHRLRVGLLLQRRRVHAGGRARPSLHRRVLVRNR